VSDAAKDFEERGRGKLPGYLGIEVLEAEPGAGRTVLRLPVKTELLAPNGYLHAAAVVALADTAAGYGCVRSLPEGAAGFTTIELKSNFLGTLTEGALRCEATMVHGAGRPSSGTRPSPTRPRARCWRCFVVPSSSCGRSPCGP
jgi:1,4-dihydroxy-2-naphthoyl-CoA hydrolase